MERKTFKDILKQDIDNTFLNVYEFSDIHNVDGTDMPVQVDDNEIIEREKKEKSHMDGIYVKQKLIYVKAKDFGVLPALERQIMLDGKRYFVSDATDESGIYAITLVGNRSK